MEINPVRVSCHVGYKRNMGNFETLSLDFSVEDSARPGEKVTEASERVYDFVSKMLVTKMNELNEELGAQKGN